MLMAEQQSGHRISQETKKLDSGIASEKRGSWFAFIICMFVIAVGAAFIWAGKSIPVGTAAIFSSLAYLVWSFQYARRGQRKELAQKEAALTERLER